MIPDERTCQYFITIAREKIISRAARSLYISQPTLSRFLTGLEKNWVLRFLYEITGSCPLRRQENCFSSTLPGLKGMESRFSNDLSSLLLPPETDSEDRSRLHSPVPFCLRRFFHTSQGIPRCGAVLTEDIHVHLLSRMEKGELDLSVLVASGADTLFQPLCQSPCPCPKIVHNFPVPSLASLVACPEENSSKIPRNFLFIIWKTRPWSPVFPVRKYVRISARSLRNTGLTIFLWFLFKTAKQISPWPNAVLPLLFSLLFM